MTAGIREHFNAHPDHFDPRQYVADGRTYIKELLNTRSKMFSVLQTELNRFAIKKVLPAEGPFLVLIFR